MAGRKLNNRAVLSLSKEFQSLNQYPVEGFRVKLVNEDNLFTWEVAIFGPPDTLYMGGYYKAIMKFPQDYPYSPPTFRFITSVWHPNVYENGNVCISILHPAGDDPFSGELPNERWNPTQNVRTILLSVISLLSEPNVHSPANVTASVMYRRWCESHGADTEYADIVRRQAEEARYQAEIEGVEVPLTIEEYCQKSQEDPPKASSTSSGLTFYYESDTSDDEDNDNYDYSREYSGGNVQTIYSHGESSDIKQH